MEREKLLREKIAKIVQKSTGLAVEKALAVVQDLQFEYYSKGQILLRQGDLGVNSYYLVTGSVAQTMVGDTGKEIVMAFFVENQAVNTQIGLDPSGLSHYSYVCLEDCCLLSCDYKSIYEAEVAQTAFSPMIRSFFQQQYAALHNAYGEFKLLGPEERFLRLMSERKDLVWRLPQQVLASYLDISPETFSRYKKKHQSTE